MAANAIVHSPILAANNHGLLRSQPKGTRWPTSNSRTIASASRSTRGNGMFAAASLPRPSAPISAPAMTNAATRGARSRRTAASARSSAAKKSAAVTDSGVTSADLTSARKDTISKLISLQSPRQRPFEFAQLDLDLCFVLGAHTQQHLLPGRQTL